MKEKFENNEQLKEMAEALARHWMAKPEIQAMFSLKNERVARAKVETIANELPVLSMSSRRGYKVATREDSTADLKMADRELELKINALQRRRKPLKKELKWRAEHYIAVFTLWDGSKEEREIKREWAESIAFAVKGQFFMQDKKLGFSINGANYSNVEIYEVGA